MCVWLSPATKTAIFFTLSWLQSVRSQREWKLILTQGTRRKKKRKREKKKLEMCRNNEISWCFLGRYGMMQTDAQLTSSPKDTDTQTAVEHLTATSKTHKFACVRRLTLESPHTSPCIIWAREKAKRVYLNVPFCSGIRTNWSIDWYRCHFNLKSLILTVS